MELKNLIILYLQQYFNFHFIFSKIVFDIVIEKSIFISGLESLEKAIASLLHICFVANLSYPIGSATLCTFLQRWVAKLDENGTVAKQSRKDQTSKIDRSSRCFKKIFDDYAAKVYVLTSAANI